MFAILLVFNIGGGLELTGTKVTPAVDYRGYASYPDKAPDTRRRGPVVTKTPIKILGIIAVPRFN